MKVADAINGLWDTLVFPSEVPELFWSKDRVLSLRTDVTDQVCKALDGLDGF